MDSAMSGISKLTQVTSAVRSTSWCRPLHKRSCRHLRKVVISSGNQRTFNDQFSSLTQRKNVHIRVHDVCGTCSEGFSYVVFSVIQGNTPRSTSNSDFRRAEEELNTASDKLAESNAPIEVGQHQLGVVSPVFQHL